MINPTPLPTAAEALAALKIPRKRDKRSRKRTPLATPGTLCDMRAGVLRRIALTTRDVSPCGLGFETAERLEPNRMVLLYLESGHVHKLILSRIAYVLALVGGRYRLGAAFLDISDAAPDPAAIPTRWKNLLDEQDRATLRPPPYNPGRP